MNRKNVRISGLAVVAFLGLLPLPAAADLVYEQVTRGEGEAAKAMNMTSRVWVSERGAKMEILAGPDNPSFKKGNYILTRPNDPGMTIVDPDKKTYTRFEVGQMVQAMQAPQRGQDGGRGGKPTITDATSEKLLDEEGPALLGYPTRHQKYHISYTTTMSMAGTEMVTATDSIEETWSTEALGESVAKLLAGIGRMPGSSEMSQLGEARKAIQIKGVVLKRTVTSTSKMIPGKGFGGGMMAKMMNKNMKPSETTTEVTKLEKQAIPASMFAIPADYTETDMFGGGSKMPNLNDPSGK
jgi:hypothetical protein